MFTRFPAALGLVAWNRVVKCSSAVGATQSVSCRVKAVSPALRPTAPSRALTGTLSRITVGSVKPLTATWQVWSVTSPLNVIVFAAIAVPEAAIAAKANTTAHGFEVLVMPMFLV